MLYSSIERQRSVKVDRVAARTGPVKQGWPPTSAHLATVTGESRWTLTSTYPIGVGCTTADSYGYGEENSSLLGKEWVEMVDKEW